MNDPQSHDVEWLERGLDRLGEQDRAALSHESIERIAAAAARAAEPEASPTIRFVRIGPMRIAAGLALVASLGALWMARRSTPTPSLEADQLDAWMAAYWPSDASDDPFADAIKGLEADADALDESRQQPWTLDLSEDSL